MKILKTVSYPFQVGLDRLKQVSQSVHWNGHLVDVVKNGYYFFPILGLVAAVSFLYLRYFNRSNHPLQKAEEIPNNTVEQFLDQPNHQQQKAEIPNNTVKHFLDQQGIDLKKLTSSLSPLVHRIEEIKSEQESWTEDVQNHLWNARVKPIQSSIQSVLELVQPKIEKGEVWQIAANDLNRLLEDLKKITCSVREIYQKFTTIMEALLQHEEKPEEKLNREFQKIEIPVIQSLEDYFIFLQIPDDQAFSATFNFSRQALSQRGIQSVADIDCLGLRLYDADKITLQQFKLVLDLDPGNEVIQSACRSYLQSLKQKMKTHRTTWDGITQVEGLENLYQEFEGLISSSDLEFEKIISHFSVLDKIRQQGLLKLYLHQTGAHTTWNSIKESNSNMTLEDFCRLHDLKEPYDLYRIQVFFEGLSGSIS